MGNNVSKLWQQQNTDQSILKKLIWETVQISPKEIIIYQNLEAGIMLYNLQTTEYIKLSNMYYGPCDTSRDAVRPQSVYHDKSRGKLYLFFNTEYTANGCTSYKEYLAPFNLNTNQFEEWVQISSETLHMKEIHLVNAVDAIHVFELDLGYRGNCKHLIYQKDNMTKDSFELDNGDLYDPYCKISICIPSIGYTLFFRFWDNHVMGLTTSSSRARRFKVKMKHCQIQDVVLTMDEKYILFLPNKYYTILQYMKVADILDNDYNMYHVNIGTSKRLKGWRTQRFFVTGDWRHELIIIGYLRQKCSEYEMNMMASDLINVLVQMYGGEMINLLNVVLRSDEDIYEHLTLSLNDLLV